MSSIFDLKTDVGQLSNANEGTSRMEYQQQPPTRDVTTNNFPNGAISFRWQMSGQKWWIPNRSYLRVRCSLKRGDGASLRLNNNIAPNMGLCASLFQSAEFRINDKTVSRIGDYMSQVDALETRLSKSRGWLNGIGNAVNFWEDDFKIRQQDVVSDAADKNVTQSITNRLALGFDALTTIAIDEATGILTFDANGGANPAPVIASSFVVGDEIEIVSAVAGVGTIRYIISALLAGGLTIQLNNTYQAVATAAAALQFSRVRSVLINNDSRKLQQFELIWTPPLSMFKIGHAVPNGKFELLLNPQTASVYQKAAIESLLGAGDKDTGVGVDNFIFTVENMYLYVNTVDGNRCDDITYLLDLEQTRCQADKVNNASFGQKSWDVSPSTYALTVAYQDLRAGTNTQASATKFKSYNAALNSEEETKLDRFFINYAGQNLPAPDADPNYVVATGIDYTTQRYIESQIYSGTYYTSGGGESIQEYKARGSYYYFSIPRDGTDRSTRVTVNQGFAAGTDTDNMRVLLFDHSKQVASVRIQDGRVIDVKLDDA
jgi:hypothetical protein